jgi:hypothetical protein
MPDIAKASVNFFRAVGVGVVSITVAVSLISWAFGYVGKVDRVVENDSRQDERLAKIEAWQEKANEAIITTPLKLDTLGKSLSEMKQDVKNYLITR